MDIGGWCLAVGYPPQWAWSELAKRAPESAWFSHVVDVRLPPCLVQEPFVSTIKDPRRTPTGRRRAMVTNPLHPWTWTVHRLRFATSMRCTSTAPSAAIGRATRGCGAGPRPTTLAEAARSCVQVFLGGNPELATALFRCACASATLQFACAARQPSRGCGGRRRAQGPSR